MIKLHCFGESGNAYKVALTLALSESDWEPVYVDFFNGETRGAAFRALNVMGEVPVMEDGEQILTQSGVIPQLNAARSCAGCFLIITRSAVSRAPCASR